VFENIGRTRDPEVAQRRAGAMVVAFVVLLAVAGVAFWFGDLAVLGESLGLYDGGAGSGGGGHDGAQQGVTQTVTEFDAIGARDAICGSLRVLVAIGSLAGVSAVGLGSLAMPTSGRELSDPISDGAARLGGLILGVLGVGLYAMDVGVFALGGLGMVARLVHDRPPIDSDLVRAVMMRLTDTFRDDVDLRDPHWTLMLVGSVVVLGVGSGFVAIGRLGHVQSRWFLGITTLLATSALAMPVTFIAGFMFVAVASDVAAAMASAGPVAAFDTVVLIARYRPDAIIDPLGIATAANLAFPPLWGAALAHLVRIALRGWTNPEPIE
jgi:hypothetical protein